MLSESEYTITSSKEGVTLGEVNQGDHTFYHLLSHELVVKAEGLDQLLTYVTKHMAEPRRGGSSAQAADPWGSFNAFNSFEEAVETFRYKPETVVDFNPAELRIKDDSESGSRVDYDVVGDYIDMGRFMEGVPESWGSMHNGNARNRRVTILLDVGNIGSVSHQAITKRGERVLRLVDALEAGGIRTELIAIRSSNTAHIEIQLKKHDEPLTISDLAVVSHPEWHRRLQFRMIEYSKTYDSGYGNSLHLTEAVNDNPEVLHTGNNDEMNLFIGGSMDYDIDNKFDKVEKLLVWEMSKPVPEVDSIKVGRHGIDFNANGTRSEAEILREGQEAMDD